MADEKEDFKAVLARNTPLVVLVVGLAIILIASTGAVPKLGSIMDGKAAAGIAIIGVVVAAFGGVLLWRKSQPELDTEAIRKKFEFVITEPRDGATVEDAINFSGSWSGRSGTTNKPHVIIIEQSPNTKKFWLKEMVILGDRKWTSHARVGGDPLKHRLFYVAVVGTNGQVLERYYRQAGNESGHWPGITDLTDDIILCAQVEVVKGSPKPKASTA